MALTILKDIVIIFGLAFFVLVLFQRMKMPSIVGFFITGIIAGPQVLGLVQDGGQIRLMAEAGVILLLFAIGLELSTERFGEFKRTAILGGTLQILLTIIIVLILLLEIGLGLKKALFIGFLISLSSSAVVLKILQDSEQLESPHGMVSASILIFQDLAAVPMILLVPVLAGTVWGMVNLFNIILKGALIIAFTLVAAKYLVPRILHLAAKAKSRELFLVTVIFICASVTWITSEAGLSPALGAFIAGFMVAQTDYAHRAQGIILPFEEVFLSFFFVSLGMLIDLNFLFANYALILAAVILVIIIKFFINNIVGFLLGYSSRIMVLAAIMLSQVGEFSFIVSEAGLRYGVIDNLMFQGLLLVSIMTMAFTPFMIMASPRIAEHFMKFPLPRKVKRGRYYKKPREPLEDHLIIVGVGLTGRKLVDIAEENNIPYIGVDINPEVVNRMREEGYNIYYGDATHINVLRHFNVSKAAAMVVAITDYDSTVHVVHEARHLNPLMKIIVRMRGFEDEEPLYRAGADIVISEKKEATRKIAGEIFTCYKGICELE
ncbi:MAG TPA: potassium transporter KefB [Methanothermobacter sp.]|jgi:CPA2 family monovalent cation:H+ antiporter-2|uniref:Glutathione-regulated K+/H+ antiporter n=1 Tax=Methanothermobacter tenebrarum TaxID=680118 RepID=A0ABM7YE59_9EURY|nr:cation:proton antiporter [Methanothermobacter tenebrarum]MDD3454259.1 cation:proton antiporter [Methanobacteriales archaeon]MDI6881273.1 cation:proton antiporter [Methanothermobacter sp.]MDX9693192.1 cation:proton antiporter [Methanothermobacter sp.]BDH79548.1 glutathione-regulated K+/H+ antiporter [Methanothermobacter tenebrarum]HHW15812.1 potassium transporter KefB [Methanothermobacter sp.]